MRLFPTLVALALTACTATTQDPVGGEWQLLAIDGQLVDYRATLNLDGSGRISGRAPCNGYAGKNAGRLPQLKLDGIAATRMACDKLAEEQVFFSALSAMTRLEGVGDRSLILTGPEGRSMEFVRDPMNSLTRCSTCLPKG